MGLQEEIKELEQRFQQAPDSRLFLPLADALRRAGELERAAKLCREGLERYPDFNSARILLGQTLAAMDELEEAGEVLREAASHDNGNRRIMKELADIAEKTGDSAAAREWSGLATGEPSAQDQPAAKPDEPESSGVEQEPEAGAGEEKNTEAGEMFITHTLGDIYRMQGHERKALEVYRKLIADGDEDPALKQKADELAAKLGEQEQDSPAVEEAEQETAETAKQEPQPDGEPRESPASTEGRFEQRVDAIFHFLLGDSPEHGEQDPPAQQQAESSAGARVPDGSGEFVDMLEDWIGELRQEI